MDPFVIQQARLMHQLLILENDEDEDTLCRVDLRASSESIHDRRDPFHPPITYDNDHIRNKTNIIPFRIPSKYTS